MPGGTIRKEAAGPTGTKQTPIGDWNHGHGSEIGEWGRVRGLVAAATCGRSGIVDLGLGNGGRSAAWWPRLLAGNRECLSPFSECISPLSFSGPGDRSGFRTRYPPSGSGPASLCGAAPERVWISSARGWQRGLAGGGVRTFCCGWSRRTSERPGEDVVDPITRRGGRKVAPLLFVPVLIQPAAGAASGAASTAFNTSSAE